jgi:RNA polymerase sigma factor (sigma-70 family)
MGDGEQEADADVIGRSLGCPEAFAAIFDRHAASVGRYLERRVGREVAQDLVAETFLAAFKGRVGYDRARAEARPWLFGIATRLLARYWRAEQRRLAVLASVPAEPPQPGHDERVAAELTARQLREPLVAALTALPAGDRDALLLVAWAQLSYAEVAAALEIPVGTVRSRLNRARRLVRARIGENPVALFGEEAVNHG